MREARLRESDQRMFDVQMMGGIVLHEGDIAEMKTGEGKTFVASLALYLNALPTVTTHDGAARPGRPPRHRERLPRPARRRVEPRRLRAARGDGRVHREHDAVRRSARLAYDADITYGTNSEFGFDYLRDNMSISLERRRPARPCLRDRGRGRLDPDRRGAHAADHLRRADDRREDLLRLRARREGPQRRPVEGHEARGRRSSRASTTTSTTRSTRPSRRPSSGSRRSSARSGSRTSTTRATCSSSTT